MGNGIYFENSFYFDIRNCVVNIEGMLCWYFVYNSKSIFVLCIYKGFVVNFLYMRFCMRFYVGDFFELCKGYYDLVVIKYIYIYILYGLFI